MDYIAEFRLDVGKAIPAVGELLTEVNANLAKVGVDERLECHVPIFKMTASVNRELTKNEQHKMKILLEAEVIKAMPQYDIRLVSFYRKPGNVSQLAVP